MPDCKTAFCDKNREKTNISLLTTRKREDLRKKWLTVLKHVPRKGGADSFDVKNPNKIIYVCNFHFKDGVEGKEKLRLGEFLQYLGSNQ